MGRKCKCCICKNGIEVDEAYVNTVVSRTGKLTKKRYCSEQEFNTYQHEMNCRKNIFDFMRELLGYNEEQILPTIINKKVSEIHNGYTYQEIYETFITCKETLTYWSNLEGKFDKEYQKISYIFAIIINSINEVSKRIKRESKLDIKADSHTIEVDLFDDMPIVNTSKKDISSFLD